MARSKGLSAVTAAWLRLKGDTPKFCRVRNAAPNRGGCTYPIYYHGRVAPVWKGLSSLAERGTGLFESIFADAGEPMEQDFVTISGKQWSRVNEILDHFFQHAPGRIDRGQAATVLKTTAMFEDVMRSCLESCMQPLTPKAAERLFEGHGPISTFAAKIDIAYAFNLLSDENYADLHLIRKIRNEFAHSSEVLGFEKSRTENMVSRLQGQRRKLRASTHGTSSVSPRSVTA